MNQIINTDPLKFQDEGYVLVRNFFETDKALEAANWLRSQKIESFAKSWTDQEPGVELAVHQDIHKGNDPIGKLASDSKMLDLASKIFGSEVYIWSSKVNFKAAWCGTAEYYHQDYVYWKDRGYKNIDMLTCMIILDNHNIHNGALNIIPKSHKHGFIEHQPFCNINGIQKFMIAPHELSSMSKENGVIVLDAKPGDILFFHTCLAHGSSHNISPNPRMIILSQLNVKGNYPDDVHKNAKQLNVWRAQFEVNEAQRKLNFFNNKLTRQQVSEEILFNSPVPREEQND
tara:strand:- start:62533 stop:63393 length:861 start_codon:yes stop_codon:yes gene_type:complete